jgi:hypothetical protein
MTGGSGAKDAPHTLSEEGVFQGKTCCLVSGNWNVANC